MLAVVYSLYMDLFVGFFRFPKTPDSSFSFLTFLFLNRFPSGLHILKEKSFAETEMLTAKKHEDGGAEKKRSFRCGCKWRKNMTYNYGYNPRVNVFIDIFVSLIAIMTPFGTHNTCINTHRPTSFGSYILKCDFRVAEHTRNVW